MNKLYLLSLLLISSIPIAIVASCNSSCTTTLNCNDNECSCPCSGKTYFANRPLFQSYRAEYLSGFRNDRIIAAEDGWNGALDVVLYGSQSTNPQNLASYFLPFCKNGLVFTETPGTIGGTPTGDILADNFNIYTVNDNFQSTVSFSARHSEFGLGLHWKQAAWINDAQNKWFYFDVSLPITQVRNQVCINEQVQNTGGGVNTVLADGGSAVAQPNVTAAFNQSSWNFGKINSGCVMKKTGVSDMELKFAYQFRYSESSNVAGYLGVLIPTGTVPNGQFVFEPIVGHGKHVGLEFGGQGGFDIWADCDHDKYISFDLAINALYLFKKTQTRSFDLKSKPWSRYQEVYANLAQATAAADLGAIEGISLSTPGINVFTQCVNVTPGLIVNGTAALLFSVDNGFLGEIGYNFYAHHKECVTLTCPWQVGPALKAINGAGNTNPVRNITPNGQLNDTGINIPLALYNTSLIQAGDLDLDSAAHPYYFSHTIHGAVGYRWDDVCVPVDINLGASYEFARREYAAMNRWTVWAKSGFSF